MISKAKKFMKLIKRIFLNVLILGHYKLDDESIIKINVLISSQRESFRD